MTNLLYLLSLIIVFCVLLFDLLFSLMISFRQDIMSISMENRNNSYVIIWFTWNLLVLFFSFKYVPFSSLIFKLPVDWMSLDITFECCL